MTSGFVLAIDNGSQSTKVHVIDRHGVVHASAQRPLRKCVHPAPGQVVHPDDDLWDSIVEACRSVLASFPGGAAAIEGVGLCTIRFCRAHLDADGRLVEPVLSWMDERVSRAHVDRDEVAWVTTSSGYITHRLTSEFVDTAANYQGVWPIDVATARWSSEPEAYARTGMRRDKLFELVDPGDLLGRLTPEAAAETGLLPGTPVFATANDKAVEALGAGVTESSVLLSLGTYIAGMTVGTEHSSASPEYWSNFASTPRGYLYESSGVRRGMWTVSWARDLLMPEGSVLEPGRSAEQVLDAEAALVPPGSSGLHCLLDWLAPAEAPHRRGAFLGFDGTQGRAHLYRSVLEGIILTMADNLESMERALGRTFESVIVSGGGAKSPLVMQITADALNRPTQRTGIDDAAGLGAAICAAMGLGWYSLWDDAVAGMVRSGDTFLPDAARTAAYLPVRAARREIHRYTDPLFLFLQG